jgi:hypothetical protein
MRTYLQLLRIACWQHPLQRVLTVAGLALLGIGPFLPVALSPPGSRIPQTFFGATLILITPIVFGGIWWRTLSAPRTLRLAPHGRLKLLLAAFAIAVTGVLLWLACYVYAFQVQVPAQYRPGIGDYVTMFVLSFVFATYVSIGQFIASHSPAGLLASLGLWLLPPLLLRMAGIEFPAAYWQRPLGWAALAAIWIAFGIWYVTARRISPPGWLKAGGQTIFVPEMVAVPSALQLRRGFDGLLLGGSTVPRIALQWLLVVFLLLFVQVLVAHYADSDPVHVVAMLFSTLSISAIVAGALGFAIAQRSRSLWLLAGLDRAALFRRCEGLLLRACLGTGLAFGLLFALLWSTLARHPPWRWQYVLASLVLPGLAAAWLGLSQAKRNVWLDVLVSAALVGAWYSSAVRPLFEAAGRESWGLLAVEALGVIVLRELARRRWAAIDWPRSVAQR